MAHIGKVYLVGAGPGDPGLLTLKGLRCLAEADLVLYDGLVDPLVLRHTQATAQRTCRVGGQGDRHLDQAEINQQLIDAARQGLTVVRLKGGDPFIFGRGSEEALALAQAGIPYEVVPGITAAIASAAYAGISLTHRDMASAVAFVTGHEAPSKPGSLDYAALAAFPGTLVFYMGLHRLPEIADALISEGKEATTPVAVISRGSTPLQRIVTAPLNAIAPRVKEAALRAPSLIIVGECVSQREQINWFERLPLAGVSIGITRPEAQADEAVEIALTLGAQPVIMPTIEIEPTADIAGLDAALEDIAQYDWLVFTSVNAVDVFMNRLWERGEDARQLAGVRIAAIGPATQRRLHAHRLQTEIVPEVFRGEALAESLAPLVSGKRVLWPRANRGRDVIPEALTAAGARYEEIVVYQHVDAAAFPPRAEQWIASGELDWIALGSPAIARNVARLLGSQSAAPDLKFAAISPVTEQAALECGLKVAAVASVHTWPGLLDAIADWHAKNAGSESGRS